MYEILNISNWIAEGYSKGTREKYSVKDPNTEEKYLFKYPADYDGKKMGIFGLKKLLQKLEKY